MIVHHFCRCPPPLHPPPPLLISGLFFFFVFFLTHRRPPTIQSAAPSPRRSSNPLSLKKKHDARIWGSLPSRLSRQISFLSFFFFFFLTLSRDSERWRSERSADTFYPCARHSRAPVKPGCTGEIQRGVHSLR